MKIVLSENQFNRLIETKEEQKVLRIPSLQFFSEDIFKGWNILQKFLEKKGNPPYSIGGDLILDDTPIESLGNLISVGGNLYLEATPITSLRNLQSVGGILYMPETKIDSLGDLQSVGGYLNLRRTPIESLGNLTSVGGDLNLIGTPLSMMYTKNQIQDMVNVGGIIYL